MYKKPWWVHLVTSEDVGPQKAKKVKSEERIRTMTAPILEMQCKQSNLMKFLKLQKSSRQNLERLSLPLTEIELY
jgi:hypothetical protein